MQSLLNLVQYLCSGMPFKRSALNLMISQDIGVCGNNAGQLV